uniref:Protein kinase domain-containing protein n=1 Tax=Rhizophagus irregularis (strain DAOM 181602 / DAOM 197198 / MUCL 43194) TaxID=747089 RepID=U9SW35_RHIID
MQLNTGLNDVLFEWIPYSQFSEITEIGKNESITVYSAVWRDGPLCNTSYKRNSNKEVALKCLHNSRNFIELVINKVEKYPSRYRNFWFITIYGISQNPDTNDYILVQNNSINLTNWASENEKIDDFIQERQFKIRRRDVVFEWIPYNQFNEIKETGKNSSITVYSAIWKDGPLYWNEQIKKKYTRNLNKEIALKCLHNTQNSVEFVMNEVGKYHIRYEWGNSDHSFHVLYGISQNPYTNDYILVQNNSINLTNLASGNETIDGFIQEMQLKVNNHSSIIFEWIPYNQFNKIIETGKNSSITVYSAIWKDGPLYWNEQNKKYARNLNKEIALKCLHNTQNSVEFIINEVKKYHIRYEWVQNNSINLTNWTSGKETIDGFIQEMQLKVNNHNGIIFEWIPYNQFNEIMEIGKNSSIIAYSAIWKDGPLHWNEQNKKYTRNSNREIALKCLHNTQNLIEFVINKVIKDERLSILYGISQNPDTNDYVLAQNNLAWTTRNKKIDDFIQEVQLKINDTNTITFEWVQYDQFNEIEETGRNGSVTLYSALWKDGPLYNISLKRDSNKKVALKCLHNSQNRIKFVINEVKKYQIENGWYTICGISQDPYTNDYILVQNNSVNLTNWISGNEIIDNLIWEMQLMMKINNPWNTVFEWIPFNQFIKIKEKEKNHFITVYSAIWQNGPLHYNNNKDEYIRNSNEEVALKCLHNSQNYTEFVINEVKSFSKKEFSKNIHIIYGISQNPDTNDYILVLNFINQTSGNNKIDDFVQEMQLKINDIVFEWIPYIQFYEVKETNKNSFATTYSAIWREGPIDNIYKYKYRRNPNKNVFLKQLHNSHNLTQFVINEAKKYSTNSSSFLVIYGISQNPDTKDYILVQNKLINFNNYITGSEKIDNAIQEIQLKILKYDDLIFEWVPYSQFDKIKKIGKGGFATIYSAIWRDGPLYLESQGENYKRDSFKEVALKCLENSQNHINELLKEVKAYSTKPTHSSILKVYGISQEPCTKNYIIILHYAAGGSFDHWVNINENYKNFNWKKKIQALLYIASGLRELHDEQIVHRDLHTRNILFNNPSIKPYIKIYISDMGLCGEVGNLDKTKFYGVIPYVAPEVLRGKLYTKAADIYSFGMIMYFVATERQPFDNRAHDCCLTLDIYNGIRPEINEKAIPRCYINLMKNCWDSNPKNRPDATVLSRALSSISINNLYKAEIEEAEKHRILHLSSSKVDRQVNTHPQAIYTSRLLNPFTENLPKYIDDNSECLDCAILDE